MQSIKALLTLGFLATNIAAVAVPASGFIIPEGLADGSYTMSRDANGNQVVTSLETGKVVEAPTNLTPRAALPDSEQGCTGETYDHGDWQNARQYLANYCNPNGGGYGTVAQHHVQLFVSGSAATYVCVYSGDAQPCDIAEYDQANARLDGSCGGWNSGWCFIKQWNKTYGRANSGQQVCTNI